MFDLRSFLTSSPSQGWTFGVSPPRRRNRMVVLDFVHRLFARSRLMDSVVVSHQQRAGLIEANEGRAPP